MTYNNIEVSPQQKYLLVLTKLLTPMQISVLINTAKEFGNLDMNTTPEEQKAVVRKIVEHAVDIVAEYRKAHPIQQLDRISL